jgi:hypothetical protein
MKVSVKKFSKIFAIIFKTIYYGEIFCKRWMSPKLLAQNHLQSTNVNPWKENSRQDNYEN